MKKENDEGVWEFTFMAVQAGETEEQALQAVLYYLAEQADRGELEPVKVEKIE
jgi:hypothetical protein